MKLNTNLNSRSKNSMTYDTADTNEHDGATGGSKTKHTEHRTQNMERRGHDNMQTINT